ncbi:MAG: sugar phosphate nucleotidyltransferase [Eubacteriales bacterium]|nr:sugar phosphate nucleotidyltransferase [Eubacteriales bacterium]
MEKPILVIMAAGMGSRYGGLKQIDPVGPGGQIILDYSVYDAHRAGFERVVFIIRPELETAFEAAIGRKARRFMQVDYAYQTLDRLPEGLRAPEGREKPLGTAHAVWCAKELTAGAPIAVINADDFYGADAFRKIYEYLSSAEDAPGRYRYCMVGYCVENTLTENGTVSRGVCTTDENGLLTGIVERTAISRRADGAIVCEADGELPACELAAGTLVSLNLWGFTPSFLPCLDEGLRRFFAEKLPANPMKGEYYLPFAVDELIEAGRATAKVLSTDARWFGVTYREDKPVVCAAIADMTARGDYPADL